MIMLFLFKINLVKPLNTAGAKTRQTKQNTSFLNRRLGAWSIDSVQSNRETRTTDAIFRK